MTVQSRIGVEMYGGEFTAASTPENDVSGEGGHHHVPQEIVILAPFLLLGLGAFLRHSTKSLPIPYTMQLLVVGAVIGFFLRDERWDDALQKSVMELGNMDPHLMLHIFLPPIIFESAASLEWHLFARSKWFIIALAGPGLLLASVLTGQVLNAMLGRAEKFTNVEYGPQCLDNQWPTQAGLMLGVILSATDPVAVVSLLKDLGCKASLSTVIEGESLLNDGTALVMFTILIKIIEGDDSDGWGDYMWTFVKMSFGGAIFGTSFAVVVVKWLGIIFNDAMSEITITLSAAYLCFFVAEYFLHVSGVLAVVCLGLYFGHYGRTSVSPEVAHFLEEFWEMLAFFGNTLIFVVAGAVIGYKLPLVPAKDFVQLLLVYVACTFIRAFIGGLAYILFNLAGANLEAKDQVVSIWGGLRGAVGLALAMMVFGNPAVCDPIRDTVMFHTAGIVVLTVCVNSTTMPKLISYLGMDKVGPTKQLIYDQAMRNLLKAGEKQESNLRGDHMFDSVVWDISRKYYSQVVPDLKTSGPTRRSTVDIEALEEKEARRRALMITKKSYWRQFQDGLLSNQSVQYLIHNTDLAIDDSCRLNEWNTYVELVRLSPTAGKVDGRDMDAKIPDADARRMKILTFLESIPVLIAILVLVVISCTMSLVLDPAEYHFVSVIEHVTSMLFLCELCARFYCIQSWQSVAIDVYVMVDTLAVLLDIVLLGAGDFLGGFSNYTKSFRSIRFLRLIRLFRLARVANKIKQTKIAAMNEPTTLWDKTEGWAKKYKRRVLFSQLKHGYEIATGFKVAREEVLAAFKHIESMANGSMGIRRSIEKDLNDVRSALLDMQRLYSEIAASITTSIATRTILNKQRHAIQNLYYEGLLDGNESRKLTASVEFQMKTLTSRPPIIEMPKKKDILSQIPWLECVSHDELQKITAAFEDSVFQRGDVLVEQDADEQSVHVLARGTVAVSMINEKGASILLDELGMGSVFGEIAWAMKCKRGASITATSPGLLFTIRGPKLREIAESSAELEARLWQTCGRRVSENLLAMHLEDQEHVSRREIRDIVHEMKLYTVYPQTKRVCFNASGKVVILHGKAVIQDDLSGKTTVFDAPRVLEMFNPNCLYNVDFSTDAKFMCHPRTLSEKRDQGTRQSGAATPKTSLVGLEYERPSLAGLEYKRPSTFLSRSALQDFVLLPSNNGSVRMPLAKPRLSGASTRGASSGCGEDESNSAGSASSSPREEKGSDIV